MEAKNESASSGIQAQELSLPQGGGAIQSIGETFAPNVFSGTGSYSIPIPVTPARGFEPQLALSYNSGAGNSEFGLGFSLTLSKISIRTEKGLPQYNGSDIFLSGAGELVPKSKAPYTEGEYEVKEYLPRIEGNFSLIQHYTTPEHRESYWKITSNEGIITIYGQSAEARIADAQNPARVFEWLIESATDSKGNQIRYRYQPENDEGIEPGMVWEEGRANTKKYIKNIQYGNYFSDQEEKFAFEIIFDYGQYDLSNLSEGRSDPYTPAKEWDYREDAFSSYKSAFEIRTRRLCRNIFLFHHFQDELGDPCLVKSLGLSHKTADQSRLSLLSSVVLTGYRRKGKNATDPYEIQTMPAVEFSFSAFNPPPTPAFSTLEINQDGPIPGYLDVSGFQPIDLNREGISGLLYHDNNSLFYFEPLGEGRYGPADVPEKFPIDKDFLSGQASLVDLQGNGQLELVVNNALRTGFYQKKEKNEWENFKPFKSYPSDYNHPQMEMAGLSNNGKTDMLLVQEEEILLYPSLGQEGYGGVQRIPKVEDFPLRKKMREKEHVGFANLFGDGLSHRVKITRESVECWPDLGYGNFGEKVTLGTAPDFGEQFHAGRLFLADIDGSGTADLIYVHRDKVDVYINQNGNSFAPAITVALPEAYSDIDRISFADILGNGTTCLVFTKIATRLRHYYYNFVGENRIDGESRQSLKPYLLNRIDNNLGAVTEVQYAASTKFYLQDKAAGNPWITKLPFPVQVVEKVITTDKITDSRYTQQFKYHDGYYDHVEREFKGFGYVESWDTESYEELQQKGQILDKKNYVPPVYTRTWHNTGAVVENHPMIHQYKNQFFQADEKAYDFPDSVFEAAIHEQGEETLRQAYVALSGQVIRTEVYGLDETPESAAPYTVSQSNFDVRLYQEQGENEYAVFRVNPRESIAYQYERNPADPRVRQTFTLEVDDFGNVLQAASVMLPRRSEIEGVSPYPQQQALKATLELNTFVQPLEENRYCHVDCEQQSFELNGLDLQGGMYFSFEAIKNQLSAIELPERHNIVTYNEPFTQGVQARQLTWERQYFWNQEQTEPLPLGQIAPRALLHHHETTVFPENFVPDVFTNRLTADTIQSEGGYVLNDGYWWNCGLVQYYFSGEDTGAFYLPAKTENSFVDKSSSLFTQTSVAYDEPYYFSPVEVTQSIDEDTDSVVKADIDYRTRQPKQLIDPNNNTTQVLFDPLGQVIVTSHFGTENGVNTGGMTLYADEPEYELPGGATFAEVLDHPQDYLQGAASYFYYNLHAWRESGQPASAINLVRHHYWHGPARDTTPTCQIAVSYSDGLGRDLEQKLKVEPVESKQWRVSGRTVYNNKGEPFAQYLPYFSETPDYETQDTIATPPPTVTRYDPLERVIRVDTPKGFFSKVEFTPWQEQHFDENDTVVDSDYYQTFMSTYPADPTPEQKDEKDALEKAAVFYNTPQSTILDTAGRVFLDIQHLKTSDKNQPPEDRLLTSYYETDILGRVVRSIDPRLYRSNVENDTDDDNITTKVIPVQTGIRAQSHDNFKYTYAMATEDPALTDSSDGGVTRNLNNIFGQQLWTLSPRNFCQLITTDRLQRQTTLRVKKTQEDTPITSYENFNLVERFTYGDQLMALEGKTRADIQDANLWGALYRLNDLSGIVKSQSYSLQGQLRQTSRRMSAEYQKNIDWNEDVELEAEVYCAAYTYNAVGNMLTETTPDDSVTTNTYNQQGALTAVSVTFADGDGQDIVNRIQYDAQGQRTHIDYSNGVRTRYTYEETSLNLIAIKSTKSTSQAVQNIDYVYDPVGNITRCRDTSFKTVFHNNQVVEPLSDYTYDSLYRLKKATGRQHPGLNAKTMKNKAPDNRFQQMLSRRLPAVNDAEKLENYTQMFTYDDAGNLVKKQHCADSASWTTETPVEDHSNRLKDRIYDASGNLRQLHQEGGTDLSFNCCENLVKAKIITRADQPDDAEYYNYDQAEQRTRKVCHHLAHQGEVTLVEEKVYLGNYELKRKKTGTGPGAPITFARQTLRVMDDTTCVAIIHTMVKDEHHPEKQGTRQCRFQLGNHLDSVAVELDEDARLISYEEYFPYGGTAIIAGDNQAEVNLKEYRYSGKERDDTTGLYYYGARYYAPWLGRWLKPDPAGTVDGMNLYAFVGGNPVTFRDVEGLSKNQKRYPDPSTAEEVGKKRRKKGKSKKEARTAAKRGQQPREGELIEDFEKRINQKRIDFIKEQPRSSRRMPKRDPHQLPPVLYHTSSEQSLRVLSDRPTFFWEEASMEHNYVQRIFWMISQMDPPYEPSSEKIMDFGSEVEVEKLWGKMETAIREAEQTNGELESLEEIRNIIKEKVPGWEQGKRNEKIQFASPSLKKDLLLAEWMKGQGYEGWTGLLGHGREYALFYPSNLGRGVPAS